MLRIFPNPASRYIIIEYNTEGAVGPMNKLVLSICNSNGKIFEERILERSSDQLLVDCQSLKTGTYLCKMTSGKRIIGTGKFVIAK